MVQTGVWCFLAVAKSLRMRLPWLANLYHGSPAVKCWPFQYHYFLHYPICEGDYIQYESGLLEHVSVVTVWECLQDFYICGEGLQELCAADVWPWWPPAVCLLDSGLYSICHCWSGEGGLGGWGTYFAYLCSCVHKYHILAAPSPHPPPCMFSWTHMVITLQKLKSHTIVTSCASCNLAQKHQKRNVHVENSS